LYFSLGPFTYVELQINHPGRTAGHFCVDTKAAGDETRRALCASPEATADAQLRGGPILSLIVSRLSDLHTPAVWQGTTVPVCRCRSR